MTRMIKALAAAMMAVCAFAALGASVAHAEEEADIGYTGTTKEAILTGHQATSEKHKKHELGLSGRAFSCAKVTFDITKAGTTSNTIPAGTKEFEATPTTEECTASGLPVTFTHNGCKYRYYDITTILKEKDRYSYKVDLVCPKGSTIEMHIYASKEAEEKKESVCTLTFGSQNNIPHGEEDYFESTTKGNEEDDIDLTTTLKLIKYTVHSKSLLLCGVASGTSVEKENGTYTGHTTIVGYEANAKDEEVKQVGIELTHN